MADENSWRRARPRYGGFTGWNPRGEYFSDRPLGYSGEGYLGARYRGSARGVDYERNWENEGRNAYGDRDYYGSRAHGHEHGTVDYTSRTQDIGGPHRGRGPRDYRRSDERVREEVCEALTEDPSVDASNLDVTVKDCEVTLSGTIDSREQKRWAEYVAERVSGVVDVHNRLRISSASSGEPSSPTNESTPGRPRPTGARH